ncbi:atherin-like [Pan paniscus]|uniref:atherin-like n=1 Tax=Pan paniscus TaxID=9597 RepID=UPI00155FFAD9|nr:atherin-like [Pan paniscus]
MVSMAAAAAGATAAPAPRPNLTGPTEPGQRDTSLLITEEDSARPPPPSPQPPRFQPPDSAAAQARRRPSLKCVCRLCIQHPDSPNGNQDQNPDLLPRLECSE